MPCRVHSFYRGLAGLWVCMDPQCKELPLQINAVGLPANFLASRATYAIAEREFSSFYTCRNCGTAYGRAYTTER